MIQDHDAVFVIFSEPQVRLCKTAHFLKTFGRDALPHGPELAAMMGKFQFLVGQVMKETKGKGDPKLVTDLMRAAIGS